MDGFRCGKAGDDATGGKRPSFISIRFDSMASLIKLGRLVPPGYSKSSSVCKNLGMKFLSLTGIVRKQPYIQGPRVKFPYPKE